MKPDPKAQKLVDAATNIITLRYKPGWHHVGAALLLEDGTIITGVHIEANVGRIAVCAEAIALGRAVTEHGSTEIEMIAAVRIGEDQRANLVAPCGMCRELLIDYAPSATVVMPLEQGPNLVRVTKLLPCKYSR